MGAMLGYLTNWNRRLREPLSSNAAAGSGNSAPCAKFLIRIQEILLFSVEEVLDEVPGLESNDNDTKMTLVRLRNRHRLKSSISQVLDHDNIVSHFSQIVKGQTSIDHGLSCNNSTRRGLQNPRHRRRVGGLRR